MGFDADMATHALKCAQFNLEKVVVHLFNFLAPIVDRESAFQAVDMLTGVIPMESDASVASSTSGASGTAATVKAIWRCKVSDDLQHSCERL
jgi:hypothetical protein